MMQIGKIIKGLRSPKLAFDYIIQSIITQIIPGKYLMGKTYVHGPKSRITVGENSSLPDVVNTRSGKVIIGDDVQTGYNNFLLTGTHDYRKKGSERGPAITDAGRDIIIRDGVWIGWNCTIVGPCEIGENAVIAAGSVVVDDCEAGAIYAGNPAEKVSSIDFK